MLIFSTAQAQNLFQADESSGNVYAFRSSGTKSTFASGLNYPEGLAFQPVTVPEPSVFGLLAVGITAFLVHRSRIPQVGPW